MDFSRDVGFIVLINYAVANLRFPNIPFRFPSILALDCPLLGSSLGVAGMGIIWASFAMLVVTSIGIILSTSVIARICIDRAVGSTFVIANVGIVAADLFRLVVAGIRVFRTHCPPTLVIVRAGLSTIVVAGVGMIRTKECMLLLN